MFGYDAWSHLQMLQDAHRTRSFEAAFERNANAVKGTVVIDLGCGTAILSLFAARAGARQVYCIDVNPLLGTVEQIIRHNGFEAVITFIHADANDPTFKLPEKADLLVSEWMGFGLWGEGTFLTHGGPDH